MITTPMDTSNTIVFADRKDAGEQLGRFLRKRYMNANPLVVGVPRGAVSGRGVWDGDF
jgi:hypothetical protein